MQPRVHACMLACASAGSGLSVLALQSPRAYTLGTTSSRPCCGCLDGSLSLVSGVTYGHAGSADGALAVNGGALAVTEWREWAAQASTLSQARRQVRVLGSGGSPCGAAAAASQQLPCRLCAGRGPSGGRPQQCVPPARKGGGQDVV